MRGFLTSFRGRLMVMSLIILAIGLTAYSFIVGFVNLSRLNAHINEDLTQRGHMLSRSGPPRRALDGGPGLQLRDGPPPDQMRGGPESRPDGPPENAQPPMQRRIGPPQSDLFLGGREPGINADLRRARFLNPNGEVIGGFHDDHPFDVALFQRTMRGDEGFVDKVIEGQFVRVFSTPWYRGDQQQGAVQVTRDLRDYRDFQHTQVLTWFALAPLALALSAFGAFVLAGRALQPIQVMQQAAGKFGQGDFSQRLKVNGEDELASLAQTFNVMADNLQRSFEDQANAYSDLQEAYESQKRFTADASHELRTPLARMQLATSSALRGPESGYKQALEVADNSAKSMAKLIRELLVLARADAGQLGLKHDALDLRLVISDALNHFPRPIDVQFPNNAVTIEGDQDHLERVVINLIENAVRHTTEDKPISVLLQTCDAQAVLVIEDAGSGISPEHLAHIFDRFYRADAVRTAGEGIGLGLAICKSIVEAHKGSISVKSELGQGTRFEVSLPLVR